MTITHTIQIKTSDLKMIIHALMAISSSGDASPFFNHAQALAMAHFAKYLDFSDPDFLKIVGKLIEEYNEH